MNQNPQRPVNPNSELLRVDPRRAPQPAVAEVTGHLGELAQGRLGPRGPVALVTLPCPPLSTRVGYAPARGALEAAEPVSAKARAAARLTLAEIGAEGWGGQLSIERPAPPGLGLGSSTAETLGAVRAVARAFGLRLVREREAALCVAAEGAIDPLMWEGPVLFASREGRLLDRLPPLPPMRVAGGVAGPPSPTDPADTDFPDLSECLAGLAAALRAGDLAGVARAASRSAEANQARNPNPAWEGMRALAWRHGALGLAVSHTGPAVALILPPESTAVPSPDLAALGLSQLLDYRLP